MKEKKHLKKWVYHVQICSTPDSKQPRSLRTFRMQLIIGKKIRDASVLFTCLFIFLLSVGSGERQLSIYQEKETWRHY